MSSSFSGYGFGYSVASWGITYNQKTYSKKQPRNWADFWDVKSFPGPRTMFGSVIFRHPEYALMAAGIAPKDVYPLNSKKIDLAFEKLEEIKPHITAWYSTGGQCQQLLADEEVVLAEFFNGRSYALAQKGVPIKFEFNQAVNNYTSWVMAKYAPHKENALKFLGFISQPEPQAHMAKISTYGPVNSKALDLIKDDMVHVLLPFMILPIYNNLQNRDRNLEFAAANMGANPRRTFLWITLPLSLPGISAGCLLVFVLSIGFFITPSLLGGKKVLMISMLIEEQVVEHLNWGLASAISFGLLAVTLVIILIYYRLIGLEKVMGQWK